MGKVNVSSSSAPAVIWLPPVRPKRKWPIAGPIFLVLLLVQSAVRIAIASTRKGDFIQILLVETITDPLMWLWGWLTICGMEKGDEVPLQFKCPHCSGIGFPSEHLRKGALNSTWTCSECKNSFRKTSPPSS
jgi:rubredoxin